MTYRLELRKKRGDEYLMLGPLNGFGGYLKKSICSKVTNFPVSGNGYFCCN
jgi:hypothetical protein